MRFVPPLLLISLLFSSTVDAQVTLKSPENWQKLFQLCETDWQKYDSDLSKVRSALKREIDGMTPEQYTKRWNQHDPVIRFARIHWPILFSDKDTMWDFYQGCTERNFEVRKVLNSASASKQEKESKVRDFEGCLNRVFAHKEKHAPPFDKLLACYKKRAAK